MIKILELPSLKLESDIGRSPMGRARGSRRKPETPVHAQAGLWAGPRSRTRAPGPVAYRPSGGAYVRGP